METPISLIEDLVERSGTFVKTTYNLTKLKALETSTLLATALIARLSVIVILVLFVLVLNIGIALWLGELLGKSYYGFFIVAAFYLITAIVLNFYLLRWIKKPISDIIISHVLS